MITAGQVMAEPKVIPSIARSEEGRRKFDEVTQLSATVNVRSLMKTLPELELLWKEDPLGYLQTMEGNVIVVVTSPDPDAGKAKAILTAFYHMLEKSCPALRHAPQLQRPWARPLAK